ncbi:hypothetical protein DA2_3899 [Desulfovibrio sp. A2]|nr:hypothetical protein DA2_3899 [Desulfovibrio sp. A2]
MKLPNLSTFRKAALAILYASQTILNFYIFAKLQLSQILYTNSCILIFNWRKQCWARFKTDSTKHKIRHSTWGHSNIVFYSKGKRRIAPYILDEAFIKFISKYKKQE